MPKRHAGDGSCKSDILELIDFSTTFFELLACF